jgi:hypothetical protein
MATHAEVCGAAHARLVELGWSVGLTLRARTTAATLKLDQCREQHAALQLSRALKHRWASL